MIDYYPYFFETVLLLKLSDKMLNKRDFLKINNLYAWTTINICMFTSILIIEAWQLHLL